MSCGKKHEIKLTRDFKAGNADGKKIAPMSSQNKNTQALLEEPLDVIHGQSNGLDTVAIASPIPLKKVKSIKSIAETTSTYVVKAKLQIAGKTFHGVNPMARKNIKTGATSKNIIKRSPNSDRETMHAEIDAMIQAKDKKLKRGHATLTVEGVNICGYCKSDIKTIANELNLESLIVIDNDGKVYHFNSEKDLLPVKQGGKGYKRNVK